MRTLLTLAILIALSAASTSAEPLSDGDRQRLLAHLHMTEEWLTTELEGLTPAQLRYRTTPENWTIMDVVEHLAVAEPQYWQQLRKSLERPAVQGYKPEATDADILWYGIDRSRRQKTGEARVPSGRFADVKESSAAFRALRATMLELAKGTTEDLRGRALVDGNMDVYQWFLMISSHAQRHILQIREIKESPGYPRG
jgi:hypothetical protein